MTRYTPTIGLEIHAELATKSKMFCGCKNAPHDEEPNVHVCPVCLAHPGTLPVVNSAAVEALLKIGVAINGTIADYSEFDRKNYFYPDIPKAYQISQYEFPFVCGGELNGIAITRVHLEEDTARSQHEGEHSVVDFNRAGVPLMELVTEPVIHDPKTAGQFARELQLLLRTLGASNANMERGEMRVEANISVAPKDERGTENAARGINRSTKLGTKVEVKNLNSFRSVEAAIAYEIKRQEECLSNGDTIVSETRGWDEENARTYSQRRKETADDYRYFPDPDIPKFSLKKASKYNISRINKNLPELPSETREHLHSLGVATEKIETLIMNAEILTYFREVTKAHLTPDFVTRVVNYLTSDVASLLSDSKTTLNVDTVPQFITLIDMIGEGTITSRVAKDILPEVVFECKDPQEIAKERGLTQLDDDEALSAVIAEIIEENTEVVHEYKNGKESSLQFLIGQGMKKTQGAANPQKLATMLKETLIRE